MHFLETIKYVLLVPFVAFVVAMAFVKKEHTVSPLMAMRSSVRRGGAGATRGQEDWLL